MASIPHGTVILAQGIASVQQGGALHIPDNNILPFFFGQTAPANNQFQSVAATFDELDLSHATPFRFVAPGVSQAIVKNPNSVLQAALQASLQGTSLKSVTALHVATNHSVIKAGGGTANTAFLAASGNSGRQRERRTGRGDVLARDDRRHRGPSGQASAPVHAAGDARLQRHPLAARECRDLVKQ